MVLFRSLYQLIDIWSVPHFLFGVVMALGAVTLGWPLVVTFMATLLLAVLWERVERHVGIYEARWNPWMDVGLPLLAFGVTLLLIDRSPLQAEEQMALFVTALLLFVFTNAAAWRARIQKDDAFLR